MKNILLLLAFATTLRADPQLNSWLTHYATKYARIYTSDANRLSSTSEVTWSNGTQNQAAPAYCGVQEISFSANWIYLRTSGLGAHIMGPWYLNATHTQVFPNQPLNQRTIYRIPRTATLAAPPTTKTLTPGGVIGYFVDGVGMFDSRDAFYWNGTTETNGMGFWNRDAYVNEGVTFDPAYAHQQQQGTYHYHAQPIALRYLLGDHVDFDAATKFYSESTAPVTAHSPILGWVADGYPIYGPYGYASALDAGSGVRRMISGYQLRNGANGTDNLTATGRTTIPQWAVRRYGASAQTGPPVNGTYPLGRYMEDNAYLGDLGQTQGVGFDLDEFNGRFCVTPEFPSGTYAYFTAINATGVPVFPYNIGRAYYGSPTGSTQASIGETVTTIFRGEATKQEVANVSAVNPANGNVTVAWSSTEGGTYRVEAASDFASWSTLTSTQAAASSAVTTSYVENGAALASPAGRFYRVTRTALATFDSVGGGGGGGTNVNVPGGSAARGSTVVATITLPTTPPQPPAANVPTNVTLAGTIAGTAISRPTQGTVQCTFTIPAGAPLGAQNVVVTFNPAPTYTLTGGLTITAAALRESVKTTRARK